MTAPPPPYYQQGSSPTAPPQTGYYPPPGAPVGPAYPPAAPGMPAGAALPPGAVYYQQGAPQAPQGQDMSGYRTGAVPQATTIIIAPQASPAAHIKVPIAVHCLAKAVYSLART